MRLLIIFVFTLQTLLANCQIHEFKNTVVDSAKGASIKKFLNDLPADDFLKKSYTDGTLQLPYRLLLPQDYNLKEKYPLIITFHNSTRIGNDNEKQLEPLARIWLNPKIRATYKAFVVAPQFATRSSNYYTDSNRHVLVSKPAGEVTLLLNIINELQILYTNIDITRIYIIGYSMGGSTAQNLLTIAPDKFAAIVSIAAVPDLSNTSNLLTKPIWLIHGALDDENPYQGSSTLYDMLKGNKKLRFTTYEQLEHNRITLPLLLTDKIPKWLFSKSLK